MSAETEELLRTDPGSIYGRAVLEHLPRMLSQIDRNPHSPTYGCCCRNHWHYRIEDIPNSQLQEVVLTLAGAYRLRGAWNPWAGSPQLLRWIESVLLYWTKIQRPSGCFDEVYRGQDSYAATAFSTYCSTEATLQLREELDASVVAAVSKAAGRAVAWLGRTQEVLANNQVAGAAGAALNTAELTGNAQHTQVAREAVDYLVSRQTEEGWFNEYGGADIGYSTLTVDYLARIWKKTGWEEAHTMATRLVDFLTYFVHRDGTAGGVHGSRKTEYVIPHGLELLAATHAPARDLGTVLMRSLAERPDRSVLNRLDDRYLCYLSGFFMLAAADAEPREAVDVSLPASNPHNRYFTESGLWSIANARYHLVANLRKGGVLRCDFHEGGSFQNSGLFVTPEGGEPHTTQAIHDGATVGVEGTVATMDAPLVRVRHITVSPLKQVLFKAYNLAVPAFMRRLVLDALRKRAVSTGNPLGTTTRTLVANEDGVRVTDQLDLPAGRFTIRDAALTERSFSFASSGFYHPAEEEHPTTLPSEWTLSGGRSTSIERTLSASGWTEVTSSDSGVAT